MRRGPMSPKAVLPQWCAYEFHPGSQGARSKPTLFVMVGLPAAGKTARAKEIEEASPALRLTPDEWMIPLFAEPEGGKRETLEGRFIWLATQSLRLGTNVVLDFGVWTKNERSALRFLTQTAGASCELVYMEIDEREQRRRHDKRFTSEPESTFPMSDDDLRSFREQFEAPDAAELLSPEFGPPPLGHTSWGAWIAERWPTSMP
jgi:predicted kinase